MHTKYITDDNSIVVESLLRVRVGRWPLGQTIVAMVCNNERAAERIKIFKIVFHECLIISVDHRKYDVIIELLNICSYAYRYGLTFDITRDLM